MRSRDEQAIRRICFDTALFGEPLATHFGDRQLVTDALIGCHIWGEPQALYAAEEDGRVTGYLAGTWDARRLQWRCGPRLVWHLLRDWFLRGHWGRLQSLRLALAALRYAWVVSRLRVREPARYRAGLHINIDREYRRRGHGGILLRAFLHDAAARGVPGVHVSTASTAGKRFFSKMGFRGAATAMAPSIAGAPPRSVWLLIRALQMEAPSDSDDSRPRDHPPQHGGMKPPHGGQRDPRGVEFPPNS